MADWLTLFRRALAIIDAAPPGVVADDWTLGGGTMLFRRFGIARRGRAVIDNPP